ncbi:FUSC family protein [Methanobacterium spitsbergense]|uniref:FUSC family protein n=1 Tax=Methanobacterium spitsbergense TaxID=2874285 RepID=A0A8T5UV26_9EURY|nr:FUSC family protein [Methanobacterium spitsbergense]MBZ2165776.1 FUSC family protein [Methanobacterium spitsbergense]
MKKKGFWNRFKRLSKPTGRPQWGQAFRAIFLMIIAAIVAKFMGLDNGIMAIVFVTLIATIIIETSLPLRKVAILTILGFFMTVLAFVSASLSLSNIGIFIFFTVIWAFFGISLYIFGSVEGSLGFTFFLIYFLAVLLVNNQSNTFDWTIYALLSYLVASVLFIPKIWFEKKKIREMVTIGFNPETNIQNIFSVKNILSDIPLRMDYINIFKFGSYFKILRKYSNLIVTRLTPKQHKYFNNFLNHSDEFAFKIGDHFNNDKGPVNLSAIDTELLTLESQFVKNSDNSETVMDISHGIRDILFESNTILSGDRGREKKIIKAHKKSLREVLDANFHLNNLYIRHAIRFTIAITLSLIFVYLTRERSAVWITMGVLIILKPDISSTVDNLISRVGFNLLAIILAIIFSFIFPHNLLIWLAFIMLFLFRAFYPNYMGFSVMAITVFIVLIWPTGTVFDNAISRLVDIALGGIIAFICAYIILPSRVNVNLPNQLFRTIQFNINTANQILMAFKKKINNKKVSKCFNNYMKEENNLEAAVKKLEDSYKDINDDLELYQEIIASNNKLAADLLALSAIFNKNEDVSTSFETKFIEIKNMLHNIENFLNGDLEPLKIYLNNFSKVYGNIEVTDLDQIINWIISDLQLIQKGLEIANETGALQRYRKLT